MVKKGNIEQSQENVKNLISDSAKGAQALDSVIQGIGSRIKNAIDQAINGQKLLEDSGKALADTYQKDLLSGIASTTQGLEKQLAIQLKIRKGENVTKSIKDKILTNEVKKEVILKRLAKIGNNLTQQQKDNIKDQLKYIDLDSDILEGQLKQSREFGKQKSLLELIGGSLSGVANKIDKSGFLSDILTGNFSEFLNFSRIGEIGAASLLATLVQGVMELDKATTAYSKSFGFTREQAAQLNRESMAIADATNSIAITFLDVNKTIIAISAELGFAANVLNEEIVGGAAKAQKLLGMSADQAARLATNAQITGQSFEDQTLSMVRGAKVTNETLGVNVNIRDVMQKTAGLSGMIRANMGRNYEEMTKTVAAATAFNLTMQDLAGISSNMLNFQSSIEAELSAELFIGKQLNLEKARLYALTGDYGNLQKEIVGQLGSEYEFLKLNVLQKQKYAAALGMSVDQMSDLVFQNSNLEKLRSDAMAAGDEETLKMLEQRDLQERLADAIQKVQMAFVQMAEGPIMTLVQAFADLLSNATALKFVIGGLAAVKLVGLIGSVYSLATGFGLTGAGAAWTTGLLTAGIGLAIAIPMIMAALGQMNQSKKQAAKVTRTSFQGLPEGEAASIVEGEALIHAGETVVNTSDFGKLEMLLETLIVETVKNRPLFRASDTPGRFR